MTNCLHSNLLKASRYGHAEDVEHLLAQGANPKAYDSLALRWAASEGKLEVVALLLPLSEPRAHVPCALQLAAANGHLEIVKLLLPVSDPKADNSAALASASENGHMEIVELLLPLSDPRAKDSMALQRAAANGHTEIARLLLPLSAADIVARDLAFTKTPACDLLLSFMPPDKVVQFVASHPTLKLPRARAMLAADGLRCRKAVNCQATARHHHT